MLHKKEISTGAGRRLLDRIGTRPLILDGGMGSQLQARGLKAGEHSEVYNHTHAEWIVEIQAEYLAAGADCILTNTFGANRYLYAGSGYTLRESILQAIQNGRRAIEKEYERQRQGGEKKECFLLLDIGPLGQLLEPAGTLSFQDAYQAFREQIDIGKDLVDGVLIETISDIYEMKAAILAVKEACDLPIFASMTFADTGTTLMGNSPDIVVSFLEGIGANVLGVNCSLGPKEMAPIIHRVLSVARKPVIVQPNAGLPVYKNGITSYNVTVEEFGSYIREFVAAGANVVGGCCGTTPEYIRKIHDTLQDVPVGERDNPRRTVVTSASEYVVIGKGRTIICGERINPTGRKKLREAILGDRLDELVLEAILQEQAGADVLDVNVGVPGIDEPAVMEHLVRDIQEVVRLPLQIDSSDPEALERACRVYNGKPLINSVNGKREVMEAVFPIVKKYGGVVLGLTLDENGIPATAEERLAVAEKIVDTAESYGIDRSDIVIDCLVLTASAQQKEVRETLRTLTLVHEKLGVCTVLGCSNVSFGLPNRPLINKTFLAMALYAGLDLPIINPLDTELMATVDAFSVLSGQDEGSVRYIERHAGDTLPSATDRSAVRTGGTSERTSDTSGRTSGNSERISAEPVSLRDMVIAGLKHKIADATREELLRSDAMTIISESLIPGLDEVGKRYENGQLFLPQLIQSAETTKAAFAVLKSHFSSHSDTEAGKDPILLATVRGDIHDIGKNIVRVVMESYGFSIIDLGKDVPPEDIVNAYRKHRPKLVGLSALMTTTVPAMKTTIEMLHHEDPRCLVMVGGAVLTPEVADDIHADYYARDAKEAVAIAKGIID